jgi:hypothetical protein
MNDTVATVDTNGVVTACGAGVTVIIALTRDGGKTAGCVVTVGTGGGQAAPLTVLYPPVVNPPGEEYTAPDNYTPYITLSLYVGMPADTEIWYTTDGTTPSAAPPSIRYDVSGDSEPFRIDMVPFIGGGMKATLKAITHRTGYQDSPVLTAIYTSPRVAPVD